MLFEKAVVICHQQTDGKGKWNKLELNPPSMGRNPADTLQRWLGQWKDIGLK